MRAIAATAGAVLSLWAAPVASAETVVLPERPGEPGAVFVDNAAIIDPHPMPAESYSRVPGDRGVMLRFTTGTPTCYGVHATVVESAEVVSVELRGGTLPEAVGRACIMIAVSGTVEVALQSPLGDRQVVSVY